MISEDRRNLSNCLYASIEEFLVVVKHDIYNIMSYCSDNDFPRLLPSDKFNCTYDLLVVVESNFGAVIIHKLCKWLVSGPISD